MTDNRKVLSLRITPEQHLALRMVARVDGMTMNDVIIEAIDQHIARRVKSPAFRRMLNERLAQLEREFETNAASLRRLLGD